MKTIKDISKADVKKMELMMVENKLKQIHVVIKPLSGKIHIDGVIVSDQGDELTIGLKVNTLRLFSDLGKVWIDIQDPEFIECLTEGADINIIV